MSPEYPQRAEAAHGRGVGILHVHSAGQPVVIQYNRPGRGYAAFTGEEVANGNSNWEGTQHWASSTTNAAHNHALGIGKAKPPATDNRD